MADFGLQGQAIGVDIIEPPVLVALQALGFPVVDGQQLFLEARRIKTVDELGLLTQAASMVDAAYEDPLRVPPAGGSRKRVCRPGQQEAVRPRLGACRGRQRDLR
jgi:hypothetical protein